ncbi:MAG: hypothetical protein WD845_04525 [Pirellulales bacterium]
MSIEGARRVMETTCHETANQYLRFGWSLINQYVVEAADGQPRMLRYVLASVRRLEDTRQIIALSETDDVNEYLRVGWKLVDKHVSVSDADAVRNETMHFILAWQSEDPPVHPGASEEFSTSYESMQDFEEPQ